MRVLLVAALTALLASAALGANPHDGYMFWMPNGSLNLSDETSKEDFKYTSTEKIPIV